MVAVLDRFADDLADRIGAQIEATMTEPWQTGGRALLPIPRERMVEQLTALITRYIGR